MARTVSRKSSRGKPTKGRKMQVRRRKITKKVGKKVSPRRRVRTMLAKKRVMNALGEKNVLQTVMRYDNFTTLRDLVVKAGLGDALSTTQGITVFAPTNNAFAAVPKETIDNLMANPELLKKVLTYHVVPKKIFATSISSGSSKLDTLAGPEISVVRDGQTVVINGNSKVIKADFLASNGVIHAVNNVLIPPQ